MAHSTCKNLLLTFLALALCANDVFPQQLIRHTADAANTRGHVTSIDHAAANGKPDAIVLITQQYGVYNPNEVGVWYAGGKWNIFNENRQPLPAGSVFNVLVLDGGVHREAFVHTTTSQNTGGHITTLDHLGANGKPQAVILLTQHYGKYNTSPVGVWYSQGKWKVYNENRTPIPVGTRFNVVVLEGNNLPAGWSQVTGGVIRHRVAPAAGVRRRMPHVSHIDNASINNTEGTALFATQVYQGVYNTSITGVWYDSPHWTVFNQDRKPLAANVSFNMLHITPATRRPGIPGNLVVRDKGAVVWKGTTRKPADWKVTTRVNASRLLVVPYTSSTDTPAETPADTEIQGPDVSVGKDINTLLADEGFDRFVDKLNVFRELYEDKNKNAGYFYYLPKNYNLKWDRETGAYSFYIYYLSADEGGRGDVIVTAELAPNIDSEDIALAEALLGKKLGKEIKLRPLPLRDTPRVSFGNALSNFDVPDENITTNIPTDFLEPVVVSWRMERRVDDFVGAMMNNIGISGNISFLPLDNEERTISVPVRLKINDSQTFGFFEYAQAGSFLNGFHNPIDYPVNLKEIVLLREKSAGVYTIQSVPLNQYEVAPGAIFSSFTQGERDAVLNGDLIEKLWLNYSVRSCDSCNAAVQDKILGGTTGARVQKIEIEVLQPLTYAGANSIKLLIRSRQGDPNGERDVLLPVITIASDNTTVPGGELFVPDGEDPSFEYQIVLIHPDGNMVVSDWIESKTLFVILGENTIKEHFETVAADSDTNGSVTDGN